MNDKYTIVDGIVDLNHLLFLIFNITEVKISS